MTSVRCRYDFNQLLVLMVIAGTTPFITDLLEADGFVQNFCVNNAIPYFCPQR